MGVGQNGDGIYWSERRRQILVRKGCVGCWSEWRWCNYVGQIGDGRSWSGRDVLGIGQNGDGIIMMVRREMVDPGQEGMCWVLVRREAVDVGQKEGRR